MSTFFIKFNPNGEGFARREGNNETDWQQHFFADILNSSDSPEYIYRSEYVNNTMLTICLLGRRWLYWGVTDDKCYDTFFVIKWKMRNENLKEPEIDSIKKLPGTWKLWRVVTYPWKSQHQRLPSPLWEQGKEDGQPFEPNNLNPTDTVTQEVSLSSAVQKIISPILNEQAPSIILPKRASSKAHDPTVLLARMRTFVSKRKGKLGRILQDPRSWPLTASSSKVKVQEIIKAHELFDAKLFEDLCSNEKDYLKEDIIDLIKLPPTDSVMRQVVRLWVDFATDAQSQRLRQDYTLEWLKLNENLVAEGWQSVLDDLHRASASRGKDHLSFGSAAEEHLQIRTPTDALRENTKTDDRQSESDDRDIESDFDSEVSDDNLIQPLMHSGDDVSEEECLDRLLIADLGILFSEMHVKEILRTLRIHLELMAQASSSSVDGLCMLRESAQGAFG